MILPKPSRSDKGLCNNKAALRTKVFQTFLRNWGSETKNLHLSSRGIPLHCKEAGLEVAKFADVENQTEKSTLEEKGHQGPLISETLWSHKRQYVGFLATILIVGSDVYD